MAHKSINPHRKTVLRASLVALIFVTLLAFIWARHTQTFKLATTHQPERFTELYFSDPNHLPTDVKAGQKIPVSFVIHNVEAKDMAYTYAITYTNSTGQTQTLDKQKLSLPDGQTKKIVDNVLVPTGSGRSEVNVQLINQPQSIHYWAEASQ